MQQYYFYIGTDKGLYVNVLNLLRENKYEWVCGPIPIESALEYLDRYEDFCLTWDARKSIRYANFVWVNKDRSKWTEIKSLSVLKTWLKTGKFKNRIG